MDLVVISNRSNDHVEAFSSRFLLISQNTGHRFPFYLHIWHIFTFFSARLLMNKQIRYFPQQNQNNSPRPDEGKSNKPGTSSLKHFHFRIFSSSAFRHFFLLSQFFPTKKSFIISSGFGIINTKHDICFISFCLYCVLVIIAAEK